MAGKTTHYELPYPEVGEPPQGPSQIKALAEAVEAALLPAGTILATGRSTAPSGYLMCEGQAVSRTGANAALFAAIGTTYGVGNGSTTFNLPDFRGRVPVGVDGAAGRLSANDALGNAAGEEKHILSIGEIPAHTHTEEGWGGFSYWIPTNLEEAIGFRQGLNGPSTKASGSAGGGGAHNVMQPYQVVNYIIRL